MPNESIKSLVPWLSVAPLFFVPLAALMSWAFTLLCMHLGTPSAERLRGLPWYEKARLVFPAVRGVGVAQILMSFGLGAFVVTRVGPFSSVPKWAAMALTLVACTLAGALGFIPYRKKIGLPHGVMGIVKSSTASIFAALFPLWLCVIGSCALLEAAGEVRVILLVCLILMQVLASIGGGLFVGRLFGVISPASPELQALVARAAADSGWAPRRVFELQMLQSNAFALPLLNTVLVTKTLLSTLTADEVVAVMRHEIGHLREPWLMRLLRPLLLFAVCTVVLFVPWLSVYEILAAEVGALAAVTLFRKLARKMEQRADAELGEDHAAYASALEKIYEANLVPAVLGARFQTHPELYDRMVQAGHPPSWPRPAKPKETHLVSIALAIPLCAAAWLAFGAAGRENWLEAPTARDSSSAGRALESRATRSLLLKGGSDALLGLARGWAMQGRRAEAKALLLAIAESRPDDVATSSRVAAVLASEHFCDEATQLFNRRLRNAPPDWKAWAEYYVTTCRGKT